MPTRPAHPCEHPGCPEISVDGRHCEPHKKEAGRQAYEQRGSLVDRGYPKDWQKVRARVLRRDPVCKGCGDALATECDHKKPLERGGSNDDSNLQGLCKTCHSRKTVLEQSIFDYPTVMARVREMAHEDRARMRPRGYRGSNP